ncbi:MAG: helix-turn-helix domain-containing protein [Bacteroidota bacterium]
MKLSNGYLSQIINQKEGKNFFDFINGYRVEEVKRNLADPNFDHFSILGIGLEAGFKSKSTFNAVFKKMTGHTPTAYKKLLTAKENKSKHLN